MSFGANASKSSNQSTQQSQSQSYYDPKQTDLVDSYAKAVQAAGQPGGALAYTPYSGPGLSFGDPSALHDLTGYKTPQATASTYDATTVDPAAVNATTTQFMNPYTAGVVNTTAAQLARQNAIDNTNAAGQATAAGAFGGSRSAVLQNLNTDSYQRNLDQTVAGLNQQGYTEAQQAALGVAQGNQGAQNAAAAQNATAQTAVSQGNQQADLQAAQTKLQALGLSSQQAEAIFGSNWAAYLNSQTDPQAVQDRITQAMSLAPTGPLSNSSASGQSTGSNSSFGFTAAAPKGQG